jgi:hypothetical protein
MKFHASQSSVEMAFAQWRFRLKSNPENFLSNAQVASMPPETVAKLSADYLDQLLKEQKIK